MYSIHINTKENIMQKYIQSCNQLPAHNYNAEHMKSGVPRNIHGESPGHPPGYCTTVCPHTSKDRDSASYKEVSLRDCL